MSVATNASTRRSTRRPRAEKACDFCRVRKLRCDQASPLCQNCKSRSLDCQYSTKIQRPRPSNALIEQLREQNDALQAQLHGERSRPGLAQTGATRMLNSPVGTAFNASRHERQTITERVPPASNSAQQPHALVNGRRAASPTGQFHGPVSQIIGATTQNQRTGGVAAVSSVIQHIACLTAEAAKQRHLEQVTLRHMDLNFGHITAQQGTELLTLFWNRQHATGPVVYRPSFMRDMVVGGAYFSPLLLNAMLLYALRCSPGIVGFEISPEGSYAASLPFREEFNRQLYGEGENMVCQSKITTIQALLLMSDVLFAWLDERSTAWHYLGIAINMIVDLGMHTERNEGPAEGLPQLEKLETIRRVFWAAFVLDKVQSIYQGRPTRLRDVDCSVPVLFLDEFEEFEPFKTNGYSLTPHTTCSSTYSVSHLTHLCNLSIIADRILYEMYTEKSRQLSARSTSQAVQSLQQQLDGWRNSLPAQFAAYLDALEASNGELLPHVLSLLSMFHALTILLHRPLISDGELGRMGEPLSMPSIRICNKAAHAIDALLRCYKRQFCMTTPPYFITYATYVSATIHMRHVAQQQGRGGTHYGPLLDCLEVMSNQSRSNRATSRMTKTLLELANKLEINIGGHFTGEVYWERESSAQADVEIGPSTSLELSNLMGSTDAEASLDSAESRLSLTPGPNDIGMDHDSWSLMPELFFDVDPLFGFQAPEFEFESGFGGL